jgi:hypothetical protein
MHRPLVGRALAFTAGLLLAACSNDAKPASAPSTPPDTTSPRGWGAPETIALHTSGPSSPMVALDGAGNAIVVWTQSDGFTYHARIARYEPGKGWGPELPLAIYSAAGQDASSPRVAMNAQGVAFAVWQQEESASVTRGRLWASRYAPGQGWSLPELIDAVGDGSVYSYGAYYPAIAVNEQGGALVAWKQGVGVNSDCFGRSYKAGAGWQAAALVRASCSVGTGYPEPVAIDGSGNGFALWTEGDSSVHALWAARFDATSGWEAPVKLQPEPSGGSGGAIAMNASGTALAGWVQWDGAHSLVWGARYDPATGWGAMQALAPGTSPQGGVRVAIDPGGNGMAIWTQNDGSRRIVASRFLAASGWQPAARVDTSTVAETVEPELAIDASGAVTAAWIWNDWPTSRTIQAARCASGEPWSAPLDISNTAVDSITPKLAVTPDGRAQVVWQQYDGTNGAVGSSRFE